MLAKVSGLKKSWFFLVAMVDNLRALHEPAQIELGTMMAVSPSVPPKIKSVLRFRVIGLCFKAQLAVNQLLGMAPPGHATLLTPTSVIKIVRRMLSP